MRIPYVIDNREHILVDVLNALLGRFESRSLDIAPAFFRRTCVGRGAVYGRRHAQDWQGRAT